MIQKSCRGGRRLRLRRRLQGVGLLVLLVLVSAPARAQSLDAAPERDPASPLLRLDPAAAAWVESTLAALTLRQRAAQLVMPWIRGGRIAPGSAEGRRLRRWIEEDQVGGLIVSRGPAHEFAPALSAAQARAGVPLLVVSDLETGPGMRLTGGTNLPPAMAFGAAGSLELAREAGRITGREARAAGIHMTLGPVLDVNTNPRNPIINVRAFGDDPERVATLAGAWIAGAHEAGLLTAGKHFPGHGATEADSHMELALAPGDAARLNAIELVPFRAAARAGMDGVLVGHIAATGIEGPTAPPASLSARMIGGLLRGELGFDGLVITDALNMRAITGRYPVSEAAVQAILAGADVLLQPPGERDVIHALVQAVESGRISRERLDASVRRVLTAKAAAGLHRPARAGPTGAIGGAAHAEHARVVTEASITLVRDRAQVVPLAPGPLRILHIVHSDGRFAAPTLTAALQAAGHRVEVARVDSRTPASIFASLRERAAAADLVLASGHVVPREYVGSVALAGGFARFVESASAAGVPVIAVAFGTPYLLEAFPSVSSYVLAWSSAAESQRAVARALLGEAAITGKLPVTVGGHARGEGLERPGRR